MILTDGCVTEATSGSTRRELNCINVSRIRQNPIRKVSFSLDLRELFHRCSVNRCVLPRKLISKFDTLIVRQQSK